MGRWHHSDQFTDFRHVQGERMKKWNTDVESSLLEAGITSADYGPQGKAATRLSPHLQPQLEKTVVFGRLDSRHSRSASISIVNSSPNDVFLALLYYQSSLPSLDRPTNLTGSLNLFATPVVLPIRSSFPDCSISIFPWSRQNCQEQSSPIKLCMTSSPPGCSKIKKVQS